MKKILITFILLPILYSCSSSHIKLTQRGLNHYFESNFYKNQFVGFELYDVKDNKVVYQYQSDKYFTPASNTKIFTLYTGLHILPNQLPALQYEEKNDTLYIEGTGDPSFLHPFFKDSTTINFLKSKNEPITIYLDNFKDNAFGPGWSWGDYQYYYSPERSAFPIYGNIIAAYVQQNTPKTFPNYFKNNISLDTIPYHRDQFQNKFHISKTQNDTIEIPFITDESTLKNVLQDTIHLPVSITHKPLSGQKKYLYSIPSDSLYKRMMHVSDNFFAEQVLLMSSGILSHDTLKTSIAQNYILKHELEDIRQKPRWVDGSGLSRYNLFTPHSFVQVLAKLYKEIPQERLFNIFAVGGVSGTLKNSYKSNTTKPYIYAKTGSLSNNHNISGYLITDSGKVLIFSYMNNHYMQSSTNIKKQMEQLLLTIKKYYK
ncbi:D-alanyl-D-alanine carboxypeptidase/D-alanyl-D-alanine-endopeptidase [Zhouia sp. PK063]|uniref:D-alanyl-D-alanine carboxypeptidase/D-alanyl-D-alanine-endopeptidase n=1 Tax=Zhouia sp. PK063 TaxID=3373602 RepID=UPI0037B7A965